MNPSSNDPMEQRIQIWLRFLAERAAPDPPREPQYRTGCPACLLDMQEHVVDAALNTQHPVLCMDHHRALSFLLMHPGFTTAFLVRLNDFVTRAQ